MKRLLLAFLFLSLLGGGGFLAIAPIQEYLAYRNRPIWRTQSVVLGDVNLSVNATGKVEPTKRVSVGAFVSGPIAELFVDFNSKVEKNQLLARIDPKLYEAGTKRDTAVLRTRQAEVARAEALLQQAKNDEQRGIRLESRTKDFISQTELDQLKFNRLARAADVEVGKANIEQAQAQLDNSLTNLHYTEIRSPVSGIIINRKVDVGQTLAAQFQTPEMFVVAPDMEQRMHIYASVDEADIGLIKKAQEEQQPVRFTVDAYPDELFEHGTIVQVRLSSTEEQNVITYPVIVETPNLDLKLLPGMTANLSFQIDAKKNVLKIPNAALRFYPDRKRVHPDDYAILDGSDDQKVDVGNNKNQSALERSEVNRQRNVRHVWMDDGKFLRAKKVIMGISDNRFTEMVEGEVKESDLLILGEKPKQ